MSTRLKRTDFQGDWLNLGGAHVAFDGEFSCQTITEVTPTLYVFNGQKFGSQEHALENAKRFHPEDPILLIPQARVQESVRAFWLKGAKS